MSWWATTCRSCSQAGGSWSTSRRETVQGAVVGLVPDAVAAVTPRTGGMHVRASRGGVDRDPPADLVGRVGRGEQFFLDASPDSE
jgi:hypothetical protein